MRRTHIRHEIVVGWFLVVALFLAGVGVVLKGKTKSFWLGGARVHLTVDHGRGLEAGNGVFVNGLAVGEVTGLELTPENRVRITCRIDGQYVEHVREDAVAAVVPPPVLGATKVEITPGTSARAIRSGSDLKTSQEGSFLDRVGAMEGKVDGVIERVDTFVLSAVQTLDEFRKMVDRIDKSDGLAGRLVHDAQMARDAQETLARLQRMTKSFEEDGYGDAIQALSESKRFMESMNAPQGTFQTILRDVDATVLATKDAIEQARVAETVAALRNTAEALGETARQVTATTRRFDPVSDETLDAMLAVRDVSRAFKELAAELERQPNAVIFGRTPTPAPGLRR